jgi:hypothetical protein
MYQRLLPLEEIRFGTPDFDRSFFNLRTLQLFDEEHGNQTCDISGHWLLSSHNIFVPNDGSERYHDRFSTRQIRLYVGVHVSSNAIV